MGGNEEYDNILKFADACENVTTADIVKIARDIKAHSDTEHDITSICFEIASICNTFFEETDEGLEIRKYQCPDCNNGFWVDCDDDYYPHYCPHCGYEQVNSSKWIKSKNTDYITAKE